MDKMTHDELLARIQSDYEENKHFRDQPKWKPFAALRAVVELHKPYPAPTTVSMEDGKWQSNIHCDDCHSVYPCPTIQAIEKELK